MGRGGALVSENFTRGQCGFSVNAAGTGSPLDPVRTAARGASVIMSYEYHIHIHRQRNATYGYFSTRIISMP